MTGHPAQALGALAILLGLGGIASPAFASPDGPRPSRAAGEAWRPGMLAERLDDIGPAISDCWRPPDGLQVFERLEVTVRFSLRADGSLFGQPRITFAQAPVDRRTRDILSRSATDAVRACTPVALSPGLGGALAGRPFTIRFIYNGPQGRGA